MTSWMPFFCANPKCNNAWLDKDKGQWQAPQKWKYCDPCVSQGFPHITEKPVNEPAQERMALVRANKRTNPA